ncbi:DivIVA domain-containing protein [Sanguibacter hominis ATCC BAA-789]|uniref:Cell wall synthesis protein Wag31 n=1 Tax=Sanguibacter hominis ATCC BAA-789 TaxID=1312740 RepID=A0A9X5IPM4_9MICO|nr:DivIVA domain-containing protein [Sanguibacter hominis]NKX91715.1 DivIVA domain-containing protein [Sanguibacter hominis ATCC BAA-789]
MALLTAEDILNKKFTATKFREGYDVVEVDDFLDEVLNTLRALQGENDDLKSKLAAAERRVAELTRENAAAVQAASAPSPASAPEPVREVVPVPEPTPAPVPAPAPAPQVSRASEPESATGMLQLAQKLHDDYVRSGQEEGERLVNEARTEGERIVREAQETSARTLGQLEQERSLLERKIDELRQFERDYRTRLQSYLETLLGDLNTRGSSIPPSNKVNPGL